MVKLKKVFLFSLVLGALYSVSTFDVSHNAEYVGPGPMAVATTLN